MPWLVSLQFLEPCSTDCFWYPVGTLSVFMSITFGNKNDVTIVQVNTCDLLRGVLPSWVFDRVNEILGISTSMDEFVQTRENFAKL
eukprot:SAG31_NODE_913_length_11064_cov_4.529594_6_plen_86_part_00